MKFLQYNGDSVVSLRFIYNETFGNKESTEIQDELTFDTVGEIQDAMLQLFPNGDAPFSLQEDIIDMDSGRADGEPINITPFRNNLAAALNERGIFEVPGDFLNAVSEFMNRGETIYEQQTAELLEKVQHYSERVDAEAGARLEMAELVGDITSQGLERDAQLTKSGKQKPDKPLLTVVSKASDLPAELGQAVASVEDDIATQFGASAFAGFNADMYA